MKIMSNHIKEVIMVKMYSKAKAPYLLPAQIKDPDLGVGDSTVEPTLGVGLVLTVAVTLGGPASHLGDFCKISQT